MLNENFIWSSLSEMGLPSDVINSIWEFILQLDNDDIENIHIPSSISRKSQNIMQRWLNNEKMFHKSREIHFERRTLKK